MSTNIWGSFIYWRAVGTLKTAVPPVRYQTDYCSSIYMYIFTRPKCIEKFCTSWTNSTRPYHASIFLHSLFLPFKLSSSLSQTYISTGVLIDVGILTEIPHMLLYPQNRSNELIGLYFHSVYRYIYTPKWSTFFSLYRFPFLHSWKTRFLQ